jgi:hypothetical protein
MDRNRNTPGTPQNKYERDQFQTLIAWFRKHADGRRISGQSYRKLSSSRLEY